LNSTSGSSLLREKTRQKEIDLVSHTQRVPSTHRYKGHYTKTLSSRYLLSDYCVRVGVRVTLRNWLPELLWALSETPSPAAADVPLTCLVPLVSSQKPHIFILCSLVQSLLFYWVLMKASLGFSF